MRAQGSAGEGITSPVDRPYIFYLLVYISIRQTQQHVEHCLRTKNIILFFANF